MDEPIGFTACWKPGRCRLPKGHSGVCLFVGAEDNIVRRLRAYLIAQEAGARHAAGLTGSNVGHGVGAGYRDLLAWLDQEAGE